jgi:hypothetical protein
MDVWTTIALVAGLAVVFGISMTAIGGNTDD